MTRTLRQYILHDPRVAITDTTLLDGDDAPVCEFMDCEEAVIAEDEAAFRTIAQIKEFFTYFEDRLN